MISRHYEPGPEPLVQRDFGLSVPSRGTSIAARPLVILGPTTVGKTDVAFGLARHIGAEVINADKFYLYDALPAVTGQSDAHLYPDVRCHLYGVLTPEDDRWNEGRYHMEVKLCFRKIKNRHNPIIVEGCSNGLIRTAANAMSSCAKSEAETPLLIGLRWKSHNQLAGDCQRRAAAMMARGMVAEYRGALANGWRDSYILRRCFARDPLQQYVDGSIGRAQCISRIAEKLEQHANRHHDRLVRIPGVIWIDHDRHRPEETIKKIREIQLTAAFGLN